MFCLPEITSKGAQTLKQKQNENYKKNLRDTLITCFDSNIIHTNVNTINKQHRNINVCDFWRRGHIGSNSLFTIQRHLKTKTK